LFTVEDSFAISGRGLVPVPGIVPIGTERFKVGDSITLVRPDGTRVSTSIGGLEIMNPNPKNEIVILLRELSKEEVPIGTEVWSVDEATSALTMVDP
jgi:translation elongation factor EF-Tu-like GTPase